MKSPTPAEIAESELARADQAHARGSAAAAFEALRAALDAAAAVRRRQLRLDVEREIAGRLVEWGDPGLAELLYLTMLSRVEKLPELRWQPQLDYAALLAERAPSPRWRARLSEVAGEHVARATLDPQTETAALAAVQEIAHGQSPWALARRVGAPLRRGGATRAHAALDGAR